jgi:hypothetical protein
VWPLLYRRKARIPVARPRLTCNQSRSFECNARLGLARNGLDKKLLMKNSMLNCANLPRSQAFGYEDFRLCELSTITRIMWWLLLSSSSRSKVQPKRVQSAQATCRASAALRQNREGLKLREDSNPSRQLLASVSARIAELALWLLLSYRIPLGGLRHAPLRCGSSNP